MSVAGMITEACGRSRRWELPNEFERVEAFAADVVEWLDAPRVDVRYELIAAVSEALSNAMIHGNLEVSSALREASAELFLEAARSKREMPPYAGRRVRVEAWRTAGEAGVRVGDEGPGFNPYAVKFDIDRVSGRGLLLIGASMDEVSFNPKGNEITMVKRFSDAAARLETNPA